MTTPKIFTLDGVNRVFQSDVPIKGLDYVSAYISTSGLSNSFTLVSQSSYEVINDSLVFTIAPTGLFLRLIVGTNKSELLNSPSNIAMVAVNMELIDYVAKNIDVIINSYNVIATAENMNKITLVGSNMTSIVANNNNIDNISSVGTNITNVNLVGTNITNVNLVGTNIAKVTDVSDNMLKLGALYTDLSKLVLVYNNLTDIVNVSGSLTDINTIASGTNLSKIAIVFILVKLPDTLTISAKLLYIEINLDKSVYKAPNFNILSLISFTLAMLVPTRFTLVILVPTRFTLVILVPTADMLSILLLLATILVILEPTNVSLFIFSAVAITL